MVQNSQTSDVQQSQASIRGALTAFKRPRVVGLEYLSAKVDIHVLSFQQGRPISRVINSRRNNGAVESSTIVTGDLGYKPSKGLMEGKASNHN
ncbi:hypothetical protein A4A49_53205 [Nicotiana attenuata]|uniref:Uncharacterized protein n=1 Tax=Nicotiana attenuata TaxID=49451 RepID=A0A314KJB6_NICAT|nr:hypothetical protein A4A49_53205 [Nicotiana attenuata]